MRGYLLDTQTITYWFDGESGRFPAVVARVRQLPAEAPLYVSSITLGEIQYGHALNPAGDGEKRRSFIAFLRESLPQVIDVSRHTAEPYGAIRSHLVQKCPPAGGWSGKKRLEQLYDPLTAKELGIDENDLWIVAQAVERNLILVTADKMNRIRSAVAEIHPDITFEDWSK